ncbi:glycosyltransferase [Aquabacterium sp.]|uniref:glycosyltransferase n=1 Tax=Aquabacterium sp. TaxID=1872578 RepID=UPI0025C11D19|nr:glycosyltransferase family 2 protein [Aquabacterium sp.]
MTATTTPATLALVMIVRDEARCLGRCLDSVRPHVDQMVVLDTGSTDDTVSIARMAGAQVGHFTWVNDFSAARNAALALSQCDWNLVLDADETLVDGAAALQNLRRQGPDFIGRIEVCSTFQQSQGAEALQAASSWLSRVLPRGIGFAGVVHEQVDSDLPRHDLAIRVQHDGYLPEQMVRKQGRNQMLLEAAVAEAPGDAYLHYQLGKDHEVHDRFDAASQAYAQAAALLPTDTPREPGWRHDLLLRQLFALKAQGQTAEAIDLAEQVMPHWGDSPDFYFVLGDVLLEHVLRHTDTAAELVPMVEQAWLRCTEIGENPRLEGAVAGRGSHLAQHNLDTLRQLLSGG